MEEPSARLVWRDWILASCLSVVIGVGTATVAAVVLFRLFDGHWFRYVASFVAFTAINSGVTGTLQYRVLVTPLPFLHRNRWILSTLLGSIATWAAVFLTPYAQDVAAEGASEWWVTSETSLLLGAGIGVGVGLAQMIPLREWAVGPWKWLAGNILAWGIATPLLWYIADRLASERLVQAIPPAAGLLMLAGVIVGLVEGWVVGRFGRRDEDASAYASNALGEIGSIDLTE